MGANTLHPQAYLAFKALAMRGTCGSYAARRFAHKNGVLRLYTLACQLQAVESI